MLTRLYKYATFFFKLCLNLTFLLTPLGREYLKNQKSKNRSRESFKTGVIV